MPRTDEEIIQQLWTTGHFANPSRPEVLNVDPRQLGTLQLSDQAVKDAIASYQSTMALDLDALSLDHHARLAYHDGEVGPATRALFEVPRCKVPDYGYLDDNGNIVRGSLPAVGTGGWGRCHGVGEFHRATVYIAKNTMPDFLKPHWDTVWKSVVLSYRAIGLDFVETDNASQHNTSITWVQPDGGWIGLAIVGRNQSCGSKIWSRYDRRYTGGNSAAAIINQWITLVKHELGHNCGLDHSRGGVMNPSIVNGLPVMWDGDPSLTLLKRWFGGVAIPGSNPEPPPGPGPQPPTPGLLIPRVEMKIEIPAGTPAGIYDLISTPTPSA